MDYQVSEKIQKAFDAALALPEVQKAIKFVEEDFAYSIAEHKEFIACESPTFFEDARAKMFAEALQKYGLEDAHVDDYKDAFGIRKGAGNGPTVLVEGHLDTVFPFGSVKEVKDDGKVITAPGAIDDTRGLTIVLAALRAMNAAGIQTKGDIVFAGTAREEGMGSLGGMKDVLEHGPKIDASISIDGPDTEGVTCDATGFRTYEVNFYGIGGHAYGAFGLMANPLHAAARAVAKIADFQVCADPKTTFCVSNFHAGNDAGVHAIVPQATIKFNIRSNSQELLDELTDRCFKAIQEACDEETARWGKDTITWDKKQFCEVPAGVQDHHAPLVEASIAAGRYFSPDPEIVYIGAGGCVNGNIALGKGLPCVTLGGGVPGKNTNCHNLNEFFPYETAYLLPQEVVVLLCLAAGVEGKLDSIL